MHREFGLCLTSNKKTIDMAKNMLLYPDKSVGEIAYYLGYCSFRDFPHFDKTTPSICTLSLTLFNWQSPNTNAQNKATGIVLPCIKASITPPFSTSHCTLPISQEGAVFIVVPHCNILKNNEISPFEGAVCS